MLGRNAAEFLELCPDGAMILDGETGVISVANEESARVCGRTREDLSGTHLRELTPEGWSPEINLDAHLDGAGDDSVTFEWRVERPDRTSVALHCAMRPDPESDGERALVTVREHPGRAPDSGGEDRSVGELQELLDGMNDAVMVVDFEGNFVDVNQVAVERLGYPRDELLSMGPADISPPAHAEQVSERLRKIEENETLVFESVQISAPGEEIPVEINASRVTYRGEGAVLSVARDIRGRKERRRRLRTFEQAIEYTGHAVYITDTDGTIEYANPAFEEITGYGAEEAVGRTSSILKSGAENEAYYEALWETILDGDIWHEQIENRRADGRHYYADQTIAPICEDGEVVRFVAIQQDVTERKHREEELERYRQLIENVPVGVYRNTPGLAGQFEEVNPAMVEMFGADSKENLLETHVAELYRAPSQRELFSRKLDEKGRVIEEELRLETVDGEPFWGAVSAIRYETDGEVYYDGIVQDITERREAEKELRLREQRFRRLFEEHNAVMLLIDPDTGAIERANGAATEFYGYDQEELTSMSIQEINQLSDEEIARRRREADEEERNRFIFPHELASGEVRQVEVDSSPIHTGGERLLFSIIHDVTERERNRRKLEQQNEQLEVLNRVVRHDIRNDMTVVLNFAELLSDHVDEAGLEYLEAVVEHSEHVVELTRNVRALMETMLDGADDEPESVTLSRVLTSEIEDADAGYESAEFTVDRPLPRVSVVANELLSSVFRNILTNAIKHDDTGTPKISVSTEEREDTVVVHVADNGPGVPDDHKEEIFGKGKHGIESSGSGLGLYLVYTFLDQFGGNVWVTDNDPRGAVFHVELQKAD